MTGVLIAFAALVWVLCFSESLSIRKLRRDLERLSAGVASETALPASAIPTRLLPDLEWSSYADRRLGLVVFRIHAYDQRTSQHALRDAMRAEETLFAVGTDLYLASLHGANYPGAIVAVSRLGEALGTAGAGIVDAGVAMFPDDGDDLDELVSIAVRRMRPVQEYSEASPPTPPAADGAPRSDPEPERRLANGGPDRRALARDK